MDKRNSSGNRINPLVPFLRATLATLLAGLILLVIQSLRTQTARETVRADVLNHLSTTRAQLENAVNSPLLLTRGLAAEMTANGGVSEDRFLRMAEVLLAENKTVRSFALSKGTVIVASMPMVAQGRIIGVDYRDLPQQFPLVLEAIENRHAVVSGPVDLYQGGYGLIGRIPWFLKESGKDEVAGLVSVVIDVDEVFKEAGIDDDGLPIEIAIRGRDGLGARGAMIHGDPALFSRPGVVELDVSLPYGSWQVGATWKAPPAGTGWDVTDLMGLGVFLLVVILSFGTARHWLIRQQHRLAIAESEERYRAVVESASIGVMTHSYGRVLFYNEKAARICDIPDRASWLGRSVLDMVHPDWHALISRRVRTVMVEREVAPREVIKLITPTKRVIDVEAVDSPVTIDGEPAALVVFQDVTERRMAENERENLVFNLRRSNENLQQFAYIASHDLQEPLRNVASYVQLLERRYQGRLDQDANDFIGFAVEGVRRMQRLIADLLEFARISNDNAPAPLDVSTAVEIARADLAQAIQEEHAVIEVGEMPAVAVDLNQMVRLLVNLLGNAIKYRRGDEFPRVRITAEPAGEFWRFAVKDNGIGIDAQYHDLVFEPFRRLHPRQSRSGTGLGLAICRKIVEGYGGRMWLESVPGAGTTFFFTLPAAGMDHRIPA